MVRAFKLFPDFVLILTLLIRQNQCAHIDYDRMIYAIEGLADYYSAIKQEIIIDSTLSFHFTKGYLRTILEDASRNESLLSHNQLDRVTKLYDRFRGLIEDTAPTISQKYYQYKFLIPLYVRNFKVPRKLRKLNHTYVQQSQEHSVSRHYSNQCLWEIVGSWPYYRRPCNLSDICVKFISQLHSNNYIITHQVLALSFGRQFHCQHQIAPLSSAFGSVGNLEAILCSRVHKEMYSSLYKGLTNLKLQDLFTEQVDVCGSLEFFEDFINETYVDMVLEWQTTQGCYMQYNGTYTSIFPNESNGTKLAPYYSRSKRSDSTGTDGCHQHISSTATVLIVAHLRWLTLKGEHSQASGASGKLVPNYILVVVLIIIMASGVGSVIFLYIKRTMKRRHYHLVKQQE
ncbi:UPF0764 protein C16orf89-like protein [Trichoplax sp. H2]|nr:UPF0764 protein C16orf89-like protein [Trichoplax sp. H2]|eukprot:RDD37316.1 UPF0764 protein C16orf89-like protein [Trichoplax sp. H2]